MMTRITRSRVAPLPDREHEAADRYLTLPMIGAEQSSSRAVEQSSSRAVEQSSSRAVEQSSSRAVEQSSRMTPTPRQLPRYQILLAENVVRSPGAASPPSCRRDESHDHPGDEGYCRGNGIPAGNALDGLRCFLSATTPTATLTATLTATPTWADPSERQRTDKEMASHISNTDGRPRTCPHKRQDIRKQQVDSWDHLVASSSERTNAANRSSTTSSSGSSIFPVAVVAAPTGRPNWSGVRSSVRSSSAQSAVSRSSAVDWVGCAYNMLVASRSRSASGRSPNAVPGNVAMSNSSNR